MFQTMKTKALSSDNPQSVSGAFQFRWDGRICIIEMNDEARSVNSFTKDIVLDLDGILQSLFSRTDLEGLIFTSTKPNCFAAGADISLFDTMETQEAGTEMSAFFQSISTRLADAHVPTVAAIHGTCLGGGLELSLGCHFRLCTNHPTTQLGLPEIQLGILPGGGGCQRLPRLIGIIPALDLILTGKKVDARKAGKLGIVNDVVPENQLMQKALELCRANKETFRKKQGTSLFEKLSRKEIEKSFSEMDVSKLAMEANPIGRSIIEKKSLEQIQKNSKGFYPAPFKALEVVMKGMEKSLAEGLKLEAKAFGELVITPESRSLVHIFNLVTKAKKNPFGEEATKQAKKKVMAPLKDGETCVGILGAGLMGSGISTVLSEKAMRSILIDRDSEGLGRGLKAVKQHFDDRVRRKRIKRFERDAAVSRVIPSLTYAPLKGVPIVVEAVFEDISIKHDVLKKCEAVLDHDFVFATNTSSLPIAQIAAGAKKPENVVGMHFFSPVPKMPLVEIITTDKTSPDAAAAVFELAQKMGKHIVCVKDGPGFYTTRILAFQIAEALNILSEGANIEDIDIALEKFGMPVGPLTLLDEVGIDVGKHIVEVLSSAFSDRLVLPPEMNAISAENRKGRKNGLGFYTYENGKKDKADKSIYKHFKHGTERKHFDRKEIADRCVFVFMNEAARCLDEGIIRSENDGDLGAIFGLGFPPFLGGPFHYGKRLGKDKVLSTLKAMAEKYGKRFEPAAYWSK
jgi:3-hydroxyacyl-CoA dehydrogenase/enoyl-CoA hydratase/3-hydroxybutyryl-CoA epimerase